ncbi:uncharacterized protein ACRADG_006156 [Cochliomyia hominivorax]
MKSFIVALITISCLIVALNAAAVEPVAELQKDNVETAVTETPLPTNEDCIQPKETGRCFALFYRFAYDVEKRECVKFIYGGCAGNSNNFKTKEECEQKCLQNQSESDQDKDILNTTVVSATTEAEIATEKIVDSA